MPKTARLTKISVKDLSVPCSLFGMAMNNINLPDYCITVEELEKTGIIFKKPVVDASCKRGPGRSFYSFASVAAVCFLIIYITTCVVQFLSMKAVYMLAVLGIVCICQALYLLICHLFCLGMRIYLRRRVYPVMLEPVGVAVEFRGSRAGTEASVHHGTVYRSYVIYKEAGIRNPKCYYASAPSGNIPERKPGGTAFLFLHPRNRKFYTVDNDKEQNVMRVKNAVNA